MSGTVGRDHEYVRWGTFELGATRLDATLVDGRFRHEGRGRSTAEHERKSMAGFGHSTERRPTISKPERIVCPTRSPVSHGGRRSPRVRNRT
jgi:hypothetical protein